MQKYDDYETIEIAEKFVKFLTDFMDDQMLDTETATPLTSEEAQHLISELVHSLDTEISLVVS
jgi:hypothetical protein